MDILQTINEKLNEIERREHVRILHCVESGSRAWGFASPDSDYDVRFIYVHKKDWYLDLQQKRDVIEWQLDETLDINGWDLQKALRLLHNSNPTVFEWDKSPIVYKTSREWNEISNILPNYCTQKTLLNHYLGTATNSCRNYLKGENVRFKKYFYALRPILACEWVYDRNCPPPMLFDELKDAYLPETLEEIVNNLLEQKSKTSEIGEGRRIELLNDYLAERIEFFQNAIASIPEKEPHSWKELTDIFISMINW